MWKKMQFLLCVGVLIGIIGGCGNNSNNNQENFNLENGTDIEEEASLAYQEYEIQGIAIELPEEWNITETEDGLVDGFESNMSMFATRVVNVGSEGAFEYYCETYYPENVLEDIGVTSIEITKTTYSNYDAYDYDGAVLIGGDQGKIKSTVVYLDENAIIIMLEYADDDFDYEDIYDTIVNSIE